MNRYPWILSFILFSQLFLTACAIGPLVVDETGRSVGKSKHDFVGGYGNAGYVFKWNVGVTDNFDLGVHWETLSMGVRGKYSWINNQEHGFSLASALGFGFSMGGSYTNVDLTASYLTSQWEPYSNLRIVRVKSDPVEIRSEDPGNDMFDFTVNGFTYYYGQVTLGNRYWFNDNWGLSIELSTLFELDDNVDFDENLIVGAAVGWRF